jgi:hypothetical protein
MGVFFYLFPLFYILNLLTPDSYAKSTDPCKNSKWVWNYTTQSQVL